MSKKIGGFFGLHDERGATASSIAELWGLSAQSWMFANGRSALNHLLQHLKPKRFWLPAYCCTSLTEAAQGFDLQYYPLNALSPDCDFLQKNLQKGDAALAIDYFGRNPDSAFLEFVAKHSDIHWIEDRAQALQPAAKAWGTYVLYSPRKLLGVTDGGIIVGNLPTASYEPAIEPDTKHHAILRAADAAETDNATWYDAYKRNENALRVSRHAMSDVSKRILQHTDAHAIMAARKTNYALLMQSLSDIALLPKDALDFVPMGFPIRVKDRKTLAATLHAQDIFAAHHWPELPSPVHFVKEHALADSILTLPCDHRYDAHDMQRIIAAMKAAL